MFNTIKIEKGLYNLSGKTFTQALETLDPSENYTDEALRKMDAFERQLKRFDIKVKGVDADKVDKFFRSTESAALFPEFVRRAVEAGLNSGCLNRITAAVSVVDGIDARGIVLSDGKEAYSTASAVGGELPQSSISLTSAAIELKKFGRLINAPYEAVRQQRIDVFAVALRAVGKKLAKAVESAAVTALTKGITPAAMSGSSFNYSELAAFWGSFKNSEMNAVVCSPATAAKILAFGEMNKAVVASRDCGMVTPFGAEIVVSSAAADNVVIGIDRNSALEMIKGEVVVEVDKLISKQSDAAAVAVTVGFSAIDGDSVKVLKIA